MIRPVLATTLLMLVPALAAGQSTGAEGGAQAQARAPQARIDAAMAAAVQAGVPASLLESKIREGEAKRVPVERIAAAVEARSKALVRAAEAMKRADLEFRTAGELAVTADALEAGVSESAVIRVSRTAPDERRVVAVAVLADLVRLGAAPDQALLRLDGALASSAALANLQAEVAAQLRLGGMTSTLEAAGIIRLH